MSRVFRRIRKAITSSCCWPRRYNRVSPAPYEVESPHTPKLGMHVIPHICPPIIPKLDFSFLEDDTDETFVPILSDSSSVFSIPRTPSPHSSSPGTSNSDT